jgi:glycosyltransferase involved in cell wall biosynthesis
MVIVESNSTDSTRSRVQEFVRKHKDNAAVSLRLLLQEKPQGKGSAMREGLQLASGDIILIQDADLEYDTKDYPQVLQPILDGHADFVLGSRHLSAGSWKIRKFQESPFKAIYMNFGGSLFHFFFNRVYRVNLTDPTTMYKVFRRRCIEGVRFESSRFDFDFELVAKLIRLGYLPLEVPVSYKSRGFAAGKKIRIFWDPMTYVVAIIKFRLKRIRRFSENEKQVLISQTLQKTWAP